MTNININLASVAQVREKLSALKAQEAEILAAPLPEADVRNRLRAHLQKLATYLNDDTPVSELLTDRYSTVDDVLRILTRKQSPFEMLLFFLGPEVIEKRLMAAVGSDKTTGAMPEADYRKSLAAIATAIEQAEAEEERIIRAAEANGIEIARRHDANPAVVLGT